MAFGLCPILSVWLLRKIRKLFFVPKNANFTSTEALSVEGFVFLPFSQ